MAKKKKLTHVNYKTGKTWCGGKRAKDTPFDADACPKCAKLVGESITKGKSKKKEVDA